MKSTIEFKCREKSSSVRTKRIDLKRNIDCASKHYVNYVRMTTECNKRKIEYKKKQRERERARAKNGDRKRWSLLVCG